ncbi:hypothetical protein N0B31_19585 [Salinirubellus salinus]|uniref:Uncharacterized protein n=1 Tax=Salinirubellus salinus TaxID=1364945 RepID=A0A9E7R213_9EURY|nr:hypothetical protein [Salinirubellus salinus]UWM54306.1 hypothetical protein N0B31_19585 [Salinirubellus salinus]
MAQLPRLPLLAVVCLVLTAGCFGAVGDGNDAPRTPAGTPVQGTTPTGDWDPDDSVAVQRFTSGAAVCERSNVPTRMALSQNATAEVVTVTVDGNLSVDDVARFAPPAALVEDAPGRYTIWVSTREDTRRTPRACDGHVPYEAVFDLPHDGLDGFHLTVMHDGERVATWGNDSV